MRCDRRSSVPASCTRRSCHWPGGSIEPTASTPGLVGVGDAGRRRLWRLRERRHPIAVVEDLEHVASDVAAAPSHLEVQRPHGRRRRRAVPLADVLDRCRAAALAFGRAGHDRARRRIAERRVPDEDVVVGALAGGLVPVVGPAHPAERHAVDELEERVVPARSERDAIAIQPDRLPVVATCAGVARPS